MRSSSGDALLGMLFDTARTDSLGQSLADHKTGTV
jgi:hypothetical protein